MHRNLIIVALIGLLAACSTQGDGQTTDPSIDAAPSSAAASQSATASDDAAAGTSGAASASCSDAFGALASEGVDSLSDLNDLEGIEATIEQCESIADWTAGAQAVLGTEVNPATALLLLDIQCSGPGLGDTVVCEEVAAS